MNPIDSKTLAAPVLSVSGLSHTFGEGSLARRVLHDVQVQFGGGEVAIIMGPSGSGKTTFLSLVGALRVPQVGSIKVVDRELTGASNAELSAWRRQIGFIFQAHNLIASLTACQNVQLPLSFDGAETAETSREKALEILRLVGLEDHVDKPPARLSGGQRQRVAIARALVRKPKLILADEPTASLDRNTGREVADLLHKLAHQFGCTILVVTHDHRILDIANRVILLEDGRMEDLENTLERLLAELAALLHTLASGFGKLAAEPSNPGSADPFRNGMERLHIRLNDLSHLKTRPAVAARMDILQQMISHARLVEESVLKFIESLANPMIGEMGSLPDAFLQSLETLLFATAEALQDREADQLEMVLQMTSDRREVMARVRARYFETQAGLGEEGKAFLFDLTNTFTRTVFFLNSLANLLEAWMKKTPAPGATGVTQAN
ncbi:MAG: putative phytochrome sensor protein [Verrucomicrobiales bacterium]|nr:putative phytochrome sensor protein [Verrucomicrobiales bacterium]